MAQVSNLPANLTRRRSQRVLMQVAVRIRGTDAQGKPFDEASRTLAINAHGALVLLAARVTSGSTLHVLHAHTQEEQECHVVFLGPVRNGKAEIGFEFSAPRPSFWHVAFPPEDWSPKRSDARSVSSTTREK